MNNDIFNEIRKELIKANVEHGMELYQGKRKMYVKCLEFPLIMDVIDKVENLQLSATKRKEGK